jgi:hypothetical protein
VIRLDYAYLGQLLNTATKQLNNSVVMSGLPAAGGGSLLKFRTVKTFILQLQFYQKMSAQHRNINTGEDAERHWAVALEVLQTTRLVT